MGQLPEPDHMPLDPMSMESVLRDHFFWPGDPIVIATRSNEQRKPRVYDRIFDRAAILLALVVALAEMSRAPVGEFWWLLVRR